MKSERVNTDRVGMFLVLIIPEIASYFEECRLLGFDAVWLLQETMFRRKYLLDHQGE
jgi:hypothetical protein